jgi:hypothetical protein
MTVCITLLSIGVTLYYSYQIFHMMFIFKKWEYLYIFPK